MAKTLRADRVVTVCVALIMGAFIYFALHSGEFKPLASGPNAKYGPGDRVECYGQEWAVEEVLDWYAVPSYRLIDQQGCETVIRCQLVDGTEHLGGPTEVD